MGKPNYYKTKINQLYQNKDSVLEMVKVISYDQKKMVANVYTMTSNLAVNNVPVLFSALNLNNGIIAPPAINSTSMLFWGPDRQPFLLPIQLNVPNITVQNGVQQIDASPSPTDALLTLENIQPGETMIRSLGGAYMFVKNNGELELGTSSLHRLSLNEANGSLNALIERVNFDIGTNQLYFGPASMDDNSDTRTHFYFNIKETTDETDLLPSIDDTTLLDQVLNQNTDYIALTDAQPIMTSQMGHVFDSNNHVVTDDQDGTELFSQKIITKNDVTITEQISKGGRVYVKSASSSGTMETSFTPTDAKITRTTTVDGVVKTTHIEVTSDGKIMCGDETSTYDLLPMLKWFYTSGAGVGM